MESLLWTNLVYDSKDYMHLLSNLPTMDPLYFARDELVQVRTVRLNRAIIAVPVYQSYSLRYIDLNTALLYITQFPIKSPINRL